MDRLLFDTRHLILQSQSNAGDQIVASRGVGEERAVGRRVQSPEHATPTDDRWSNGASIAPPPTAASSPTSLTSTTRRWRRASSGGYADFGGTSGATPITAGHAACSSRWADGLFGNPGPGHHGVREAAAHDDVEGDLDQHRLPLRLHGRDPRHDARASGWGRIDIKNLYELRGKMFVVNETDVLAPLAKRAYSIT
jgi:hypothetical protein